MRTDRAFLKEKTSKTKTLKVFQAFWVWLPALCLVLAALSACAAPVAPTGRGDPTGTGDRPVARTMTITPTDIPTAAPTMTITPTASPTPSYVVELAAVGDIMLARGIGGLIYVNGIGAPFSGSGVQAALSSADLALGNLECALTLRGTPEPKAYTFAAPPEGAQSLAWAGFDLVTLGNNHILDYGPDGLEDTLSALDGAGVLHLGAGMDSAAAAAPLIVERNGLRIAFLAYVDVPIGNYDYHAWEASADRPGIVWGRTGTVRAAVQSAREQADLVVVLLHFGYEGVDYASPEQEALAQTAIDAGAALVIGSHSHVLQPVVEYHGGLIAYSLGNFVFDDFEAESNRSEILRVRLGKQGVLDWQTQAVEIVNGVPELR